MLIRPYRPGDEEGQARVFNAAAAALPAFKPATAEEVARRYKGSDPDPDSRLFALDGERDDIVAYAVFNPNGRVSYPWCVPGYEAARRPLLEQVLAAMRERGFAEAWAAYRADWAPVVDFFREQGFAPTREMVNFVTETGRLPRLPAPYGLMIGPLHRADVPRLIEIGRGLFALDDPARLAEFYWNNPYLTPDQLFALRPTGGGPIEGVGLAVVDARFADPTKIDPASPCFRLGAMGTETERHKRVNGLVSCVFTDESVGTALLAEAARRLGRAGLSHAAAQAPSDRADLVAFYSWFFDRQGAFTILARRLG
jgi:hypothetical protein